MKKFLLGVLVGFVLTSLAAVVTFFVIVRLGRRPPEVPAGSILALRIEGSVPESPGLEIPVPMLERSRPLTLKEYWDLLRKAAADSRIRAVVLLPQDVRAGWAKLQQVRESLLEFRKSGKPLYAWLRSGGAREYYLATAAERIYMGPEDLLDLRGLRLELIYLKETLDKIGVDAEFATAGKYKDAPEMFTRPSMSPETREVMNSILDELYVHLLAAIGEGRKQPADKVRQTIDEGPFLPAQAVAKGLIDGLMYEDQVFGELDAKLRLGGVRKVQVRDYNRAPADSLGLEGGRRIALVIAEGTIVRGGDDLFPDERVLRSDHFNKLLREVGDDPRLRGVVVRINSPGGDGLASDEIWREMNQLSKKKPLVISMSDTAASGGYYIAMTGDPIVAYPGTLTGSIGVFYGKVTLHRLYDKLGVRKEILQRGRFAALDSDYLPLGPEGRRKLEAGVNEFYRSFVTRVAASRKRPYEQIEPLAQGRVWTGTQAKQNGLIDHLGGLDRAIELVKEKAGIPRTEKIRLVTYPPRQTVWDRLFGGSRRAWLDPRLAPFLRGGLMRMMPYWIEVR